MTLDDDTIEKNVLDLRFQHYMSIRNILWSAAITTIVIYWRFLSDFPLSFEQTLSIFVFLVGGAVYAGFEYDRRAREVVSEMKELSD